MAKFEGDKSRSTEFPVEGFARVHELDARGAEPIRIDDAELAFEGAYTRHGFDLVISRNLESVVLHDYFRSAEHAAILTPGGASLSGAVVAAMTTHDPGELHADNSADAGAPKAIGRVEIVRGTATAIRNGADDQPACRRSRLQGRRGPERRRIRRWA